MARQVDIFSPLELAPWGPLPASSSFVVEVVPAEDPVIRLRGELDLAGVGTFEVVAFRLLDDGSRCIVLDLHGLEFLDVSGINALLGLARAARRLGGEVVLRDPRPQADELLARTRALEALRIERSAG